MTALPSIGDVPPDDVQPKLVDGVHLRWGFALSRGFPWHGYYLFRRPSRKPRWVCASRSLGDRQPGELSTPTFETAFGTWSSDRPIVLTDAFPQPGYAEVSLDDRKFLRCTFAADLRAWRVHVQLGLLDDRCRAYSAMAVGRRPNPWVDDGVTIRVFRHDGSPAAAVELVGWGGAVGIDCGRRTEIALDEPAEHVVLVVSRFALAGRVEFLDARGNQLGEEAIDGPGRQTVTFQGRGIARVVLHAPQGELLLHRLCIDPKERGGEVHVPVRALSGETVVDAAVARGHAGEVVDVELRADAITALVFSPARAVVVDVCVVRVDDDAHLGWDAVKNFTYPMPLPVARAGYPCPTRPPTEAAAEAMGVGRVAYGPGAPWGGPRFTEMHDLLEQLVAGGPAGPPMYQREVAYPEEGGQAVTMPRQRPLHLVVMGALHPAVAQLVGLYFIDRTAQPGDVFDYLIVADHDGRLEGTYERALSWIRTHPGFPGVDAWISFGVEVAPAPPLDAPGGLRAFSLSAALTTHDDGTTTASSNLVGLHWDRGVNVAGKLQAGRPVAFFLDRAALGDAEPADAPAPGDFTSITPEPITIAGSSADPTPPADWPPARLLAFDPGLADGWYAYRLVGRDLFGRHSPPSAPARWFQWAPAPVPRPWYYTEPEADREVHPFAVRVLDKVPPPPPVAVEAVLLDPADPLVVRDARHDAWRAQSPGVVGLRVKWAWSDLEARHAPDAREFRIYWTEGRFHAWDGEVTAVTAAGATESEVATTIVRPAGAPDLTGAILRTDGGPFTVTGDDGSDPVRLRVAHRGPADDVAPPASGACTISIAHLAAHPAYRDASVPATWAARVHAVAIADHVSDTIVDGVRIRRYDVLLPPPGSGAPDHALAVTTARPVVYAQVGVSAADDKLHTADDPRWTGTTSGDRPGNESRVAGPSTVFRVRREPPPPPLPVADAEVVYASGADFHGRSFYSVRWRPMASTRVHVYRATDHALFEVDWAQRPRGPLDVADDTLFPAAAAEPIWNAAKRASVAAQLDALDAFPPTAEGKRLALAAYRALPPDALRILGGLPGNDRAFVQVTVAPLDPADPATANRRGPDDAAGAPIDPALRVYLDALDGRARNRSLYRTAYVDRAHNRGPLGLAAPPVHLPAVTPPRRPTLAEVRAGDAAGPADGAITLTWPVSREPAVVEYRVFRTDRERDAGDLRRMTAAGTVAIAAPDARPPRASWTDVDRPGGTTFHYCIAAVDAAGNVSEPSPPRAARAFADPRPAPPAWQPAVVDAATGAATLSWIAAVPDLRVLVERRLSTGGDWIRLGGWLARGTASYVDTQRGPTDTFEYRLRVLDAAGKQNRHFDTVVG